MSCAAPVEISPVNIFSAILPPQQITSSSHGDAKRPSARDDRYLVEGVCVLREKLEYRVARLVPRRDLAVLLRVAGAFALTTPENLVARLFERLHVDGLEFLPDGHERGFVEEVREVRAREAGCAARDAREIGVRAELDLLAVERENLLATL